MKVPTFRIRNRVTGRITTVNQADYHSDFRTGHGRFTSVLSGGDWEIISENHAGGDEGYRLSKQNIDMMVGIEMNRERDGRPR